MHSTCELNQNYKTSPKVCVPKPALGTDDDPWHAKETTACKEICFPAVTPPKISEPFGPRDEHHPSACSRRRAAKAGRWLLGTPAAPYVFFPYASMGKDHRLQPERAQAPSHFGTEHGPQQCPSPGQTLAEQALSKAKPSWKHTALTVSTCHSPGFQRGSFNSPAPDRQLFYPGTTAVMQNSGK